MTASALSPVTAIDTMSMRTTRTAFTATLFGFILSTLFDPSDKIFSLKIPLYLLSWAAGILYCLVRPEALRIPLKLVLYCATMVTIPLISITKYYLVDGRDPFEGFVMIKAYVFISMALLLYVTGTNALRHLATALTILAVTIVALSVVVLMFPILRLPLYAFGEQYGIFSIDNRDYGGLVLFQMYFHTSSMLAIAIAYYFGRASSEVRRKRVYILVVLINLAALVLAGSRNNLLAALLLPSALWVHYARNRLAAIALVSVAGAAGMYLMAEQIQILINPLESSNSTKLALLSDYARGFSDPIQLLFGQGLGAYQSWTGRTFYYVTELTYLEVFRNFGLPLGMLMLGLLAFPIIYAFVLRPTYCDKHIIVGYVLYLVMAATNPLLFSSMGMLILSILVANTFLDERQRARV